MKTNTRNTKYALILLATGLFTSLGAVAASNDHGEGRDEDRGNQRDAQNNSQPNSAASGNKAHFDAHQRVVVRDYFAQQYRGAGRCPPGLAKKRNGCNPPGQVKQWQLGQQLPAEVTWYELSRRLERQLGEAPAGYRYAGVDNNILLLELGTQVVVDVIQALGE